jgi:hypothetical protein
VKHPNVQDSGSLASYIRMLYTNQCHKMVLRWESGSMQSENQSVWPRREERVTKAEPSLWAWAPLALFVTAALTLSAISAIVT